MQNTYSLSTTILKGNFQVSPDFVPRYVSVMNSSAATIYIMNGVYTELQQNVIPIHPGVYLSFVIREDYHYSVFWEADAYMSVDNNKFTLSFSDQPLFLQGGKMSSDGAATDVNILNTPTVNVGGTIAATLSPSTDTIGFVGLNAGANIIGKVGLNTGTNSVGTVGLDAGTNSIGIVGLNAGTNSIGTVGLNAGSQVFVNNTLLYTKEMPNTLGAIGTTIVGTTATQLLDAAASGIVLSSADTNTATIMYGSSSQQTLYLLPGQTITLPLTEVWLKVASGTATLGRMFLR